MPPPIATSLCLLLIAALLILDSRAQKTPSLAVWIPFTWLLILSSRSVTEWLAWETPVRQSAEDLAEGSPTDRMVFFLLIVVGCWILTRRRISITQVIRSNAALALLFLYCAVSVLWSDFPAVAAKRWFKWLGDPIMVLILLTEGDPAGAVAFVFKRLAFLLIPLSVLFIKYYPLLGRSSSFWTGEQYYQGVTTNKNLLGYLLMVFGLYFICALVSSVRRRRLIESGTAVLMLMMIAWLFRIADTKTPLMCLSLSTLVVTGMRVPIVKRHFGKFCLAALVLAIGLQGSFNLAENVVGSAGRDMTLTGRTELWATLFPMVSHPLIGAGFESFWLGDRLTKLWEVWPFKPTQAHNGYIEVYLNLGWIGLLLILTFIAAAFRHALRRMKERADRGGPFDFGEYAMAYVMAFVLYNVTEGIIKPHNFLFVVLMIFVTDYSISAAAVSAVAHRRGIATVSSRNDPVPVSLARVFRPE
jgi:exopolysaccharide production protein ExoQ